MFRHALIEPSACRPRRSIATRPGASTSSTRPMPSQRRASRGLRPFNEADLSCACARRATTPIWLRWASRGPRRTRGPSGTRGAPRCSCATSRRKKLPICWVFPSRFTFPRMCPSKAPGPRRATLCTSTPRRLLFGLRSTTHAAGAGTTVCSMHTRGDGVGGSGRAVTRPRVGHHGFQSCRPSLDGMLAPRLLA